MITHSTTATQYAGDTGTVPDAREALLKRLSELEPDQPLALAAHLNGTPTLTNLAQLSTGEITSMLGRLTLPTSALATWMNREAERDGETWLR